MHLAEKVSKYCSVMQDLHRAIVTMNNDSKIVGENSALSTELSVEDFSILGEELKEVYLQLASKPYESTTSSDIDADSLMKQRYDLKKCE